MSCPVVPNHTLTRRNDAPVLLFLHGFLGCGEDWDEIIELPAGQFSFLRVDLPGHGSAPPEFPAEQYQMEHTGGLVIDLLDHLHISRCHLIGYSMGGRLGLYLLAHYPERFARAVIESASPGLRTEEERAARCRHDEHVADQLGKRAFEDFLSEWYNQPLFRTIDQTDPRFVAMLDRRRKSVPGALAMSLRYMGTGVQPPLWDRMSNINHPILFVAGEKDAKFSALADEMANLCPDGRSAIIPHVGHLPHFESPAEFCVKIVQFLNQNE